MDIATKVVDINYNNKTNEVLTIDKNIVHVLSATTFKEKKKIKLDKTYHAIGYDSKTNQYVLASSSGNKTIFHIMDENFKEKSKFSIVVNMTRQSLTVKNGVIYYCTYESGKKTKYQKQYDGVLKSKENAIYVYDLNGNKKTIYYIPKTYNNENFKMGTRKLRGYESNGMLAGIDELDLGDDDSGIVEINPKDAKPGDKFADIFDLNDVILDIENKSLTHRPDCFGLIGFAREIAGILGQKFNEPEIFSDPDFATKRLKNILSSTAHSVSIEISDPEICPAYGAAVINIEQAPKPTKYLTKDAVFLLPFVKYFALSNSYY